MMTNGDKLIIVYSAYKVLVEMTADLDGVDFDLDMPVEDRKILAASGKCLTAQWLLFEAGEELRSKIAQEPVQEVEI